VAVVFVVLSLFIATISLLPPNRLAPIISVTLLLQPFYTGGKYAAPLLSSAPAPLDFYSFLGVFNFESSILKPGCDSPAMSLATEIFETIALFFGLAVLSTLGSAAHISWAYRHSDRTTKSANNVVISSPNVVKIAPIVNPQAGTVGRHRPKLSKGFHIH
jgi:hypothetical protein